MEFNNDVVEALLIYIAFYKKHIFLSLVRIYLDFGTN